MAVLPNHLPYRSLIPPKIDPQNAFNHDERLIGVRMMVPNEVASQLDGLELIVIHFGDDLGSPVLRDCPE
jgi:hypothetical protein